MCDAWDLILSRYDVAKMNSLKKRKAECGKAKNLMETLVKEEEWRSQGRFHEFPPSFLLLEFVLLQLV